MARHSKGDDGARRRRRHNTQSRIPAYILTVIIIVYLALAGAYAVGIPKWNAPDEPSHYNYVKSVAQDRAFPILLQGDYDFDYLEKLKAARFPDGMSIDSLRYESHQPPLYYLLATPLFWATSALPINGQVVALRMFSALFGALTILAAYQILCRVFPDDAVVGLAVAAFIASVPMYIAITAAINNDSLAILLLSLAVLACIEVIGQTAREDAMKRAPTSDARSALVALGNSPRGDPRPHFAHAEASGYKGSVLRGIPVQEYVVLGTLLGLALLTKTTASLAVILVACAVLGHELRSTSTNASAVRALRSASLRLARIYAVALAISAWWFVRNAWVYGSPDLFGLKRHDLVVIGQPLAGPLNLSAVKRFAIISFQSFWAQFGWMGILVDERIYVLLWGLCGLAGLGLVFFLIRVSSKREALTPYQTWSLGLLALSLLLLSAGVMQYNLVYIQAQGRYFFPAIVAIGTFFVLGIKEIASPRHARTIFVLLFAGMFAFDVVALVRFILPTFSP